MSIVTGPRDYFHLGEKSSVFIDVALLIDTNINSEKTSSVDLGHYSDSSAEAGSSFGLGY